ncbi:hypothetical protein AX15_005944 [Amanita polypyramis BW_CC]|nr:hypothetical protein AX15_005944 [Amanita polypyramis BW_CC]
MTTKRVVRGPMNMVPTIVHGNPDDPSKGTHFLGLDLVNSAVRAMGWSFFASLFSGMGSNDNVREGLKLFALGTLAEAGRRLSNWAFDRFRLRYCITAYFNEGDPAYEWLVNYLTHQDVWRRSREFTVSAKSSKLKWGIKLRSIESAEYVPMYDQPHLFRWKKHWIEIQQKRGPGSPQPHVFENQTNQGNSLILTIYTLNVNILSELVEEARLRYIEGRRPHVIIHSIDFAFGNVWNVVKRKNRRSLESIILPDGLLDSIVTDVKDFLQMEKWYTKAGIPYKRGYLLYGPPGTGKTSTIYALAGELGLEIYTLSLSSSIVNDDILQRAASTAPKHSILLLEDIDCAFPSREEEEKPEPSAYGVPPWVQQGKITMSGLLNMLDGVGSEDGKLFFATTNYIDRLDLALIRPGRIDVKVEYKLSTIDQVHALFTRIYLPQGQVDGQTKDSMESLAQSFASKVPENEFTTAELQGYLLIHRKSPEKAVEGVLKWVKQERAERERRREAAEEEQRKKLAKKLESSRTTPAYGVGRPGGVGMSPAHVGGPGGIGISPIRGGGSVST